MDNEEARERFIPATGWSIFLPWYDRLLAGFTPEVVYRWHTVERCGLRPGDRVLDAGCGTGTMLGLLAERYPQSVFFGLDPDLRVLELARRKQPADCKPQIQWLCGSAMALPFESASLDVITTSLVFHHLNPADKLRALGEMYRVLRPGGQVWLTDFARPSDWLQRLQYGVVQLVDGWKTTQCNALDRLPGLIATAGFETVDETLSCKSWLGTIRTYRAVKA